MRILFQIALVALGSATGGLARWGASTLVARWLGTGFPYGTLLVNVSGSLFLGWFATVLTERVFEDHAWLRADDLRLLVAVGFTGAYTTFSTFEYETYALLRTGHQLSSTLYMIGSVSLGLLAMHFGISLGKAP